MLINELLAPIRLEEPARVNSLSRLAPPRDFKQAEQIFRSFRPGRRPSTSLWGRIWGRLRSKIYPRRRRRLPKSTFVLHLKWGGLGDHLFYSHLPRIAKQLGYKQVFIDTLSEFRRDDYRWIWALNPFVDGFVDAEPTNAIPDFGEVAPEMNLLDRILLDCGLDDGRRWHEPEFYYLPQRRPEFENKVVYDPNYVSDVGHVDTSRMEARLEELGIVPDCQLELREKHFALEGLPTISTPSLFDYCDLIHSCRQFVCLTSGGATLAAALQRECIAVYGQGQKPMFHHSRLHTYLDASPRENLGT